MMQTLRQQIAYLERKRDKVMETLRPRPVQVRYAHQVRQTERREERTMWFIALRDAGIIETRRELAKIPPARAEELVGMVK